MQRLVIALVTLAVVAMGCATSPTARYAPEDIAFALPGEVGDTRLDVITLTAEQEQEIFDHQGLRDLLLPFDKTPADLRID